MGEDSLLSDNKPVILVVAAVIKKEGRFLLAQRFDHASQGGLWEFPGGKVEDGGKLPSKPLSVSCKKS